MNISELGKLGALLVVSTCVLVLIRWVDLNTLNSLHALQPHLAQGQTTWNIKAASRFVDCLHVWLGSL